MQTQKSKFIDIPRLQIQVVLGFCLMAVFSGIYYAWTLFQNWVGRSEMIEVADAKGVLGDPAFQAAAEAATKISAIDVFFLGSAVAIMFITLFVTISALSKKDSAEERVKKTCSVRKNYVTVLLHTPLVMSIASIFYAQSMTLKTIGLVKLAVPVAKASPDTVPSILLALSYSPAASCFVSAFILSCVVGAIVGVCTIPKRKKPQPEQPLQASA